MSSPTLESQCSQFFHGHRRPSAAAQFSAMAHWCEQHDIKHDRYGDGEVIQNFEAKIANLTGYPAALFCITGTMAQLVALKIACQRAGSDLVGLHSSAHLLIHENSNYQVLNQFKTLTIGQAFRPWLAADWAGMPERLGALLYELPMREIGAQMPSWEKLEEIKALAKQRNTHLHMDGARLWEAACGYGRSLPEVCRGFDSCYVSLYKGINGLGGAILLGERDFIEQARVGMKRLGGNVVYRLPYVVAAAMQFDERLAAMPQYLQKTRELYAILAKFPRLSANPAQPACNMLHLYFPVTPTRLNAIRDEIAQEEKLWLFGNGRNTALPNQSMVELYVGDNLLELPNQRIAQVLQILSEKLGV